MANNKNKEGLLDDFLNIITKDVRTFAIFVIAVAGLILSTVGLLVAIAVCLALKMIRLRIITLAVIVISFIAIVIGWYFYHANYLVLQYHNKILWLSILHGQKFMVLQNSKIWLYAAPYGFLLGGLMQLMIKPSGSALQKEVETLLKREEKRTTQKWLSEKNLQRRLAQLKCAYWQDSTILGVDRNTGKTIALSDTDANLHTLVVGTTGCGKTTALSNLMESTIARRMPLFYIDGKGDLPLAAKLEQFAKAHKVPFYRFSMLGESDKYNPLASGGFTAKKDRIIALREWTEAHYRKIAEGYLQTVFKVLTAANIAIDGAMKNRVGNQTSIYHRGSKSC
jgi:hypothetical protein